MTGVVLNWVPGDAAPAAPSKCGWAYTQQHLNAAVSLCLRVTETLEVSQGCLCLDIIGDLQDPLGLSFVCRDTMAKPGHKG